MDLKYWVLNGSDPDELGVELRSEMQGSVTCHFSDDLRRLMASEA
jgi:hypothetical protein